MKSRRRSNITLPDPVFFIDRNLGAKEMPTALRAAGFSVIVHDDHFHNRQGVLDPEVIQACGQHGWLLLTGDSDLTRRWAKEIIQAEIGVFCQTNNHHGPRLWAPKICQLKPRIIKLAQRQPRPFIAFIIPETKARLELKRNWPTTTVAAILER